MAASPSPEVKAILMQTYNPNEPLGLLLSKGFVSEEIMSKMFVSYTLANVNIGLCNILHALLDSTKLP